MHNKLYFRVLGRIFATALFCVGLFIVAQAYTMAFHGIYIDCFAPDQSGCALRHYADPTLLSALYGTGLAILALITFYLGARTLRWLQKREK